jgi:predicted Zn-dependent protease
LPRAHEFARELFHQYPSNAAFASTYAYSLHLQGRSEEALKAFANLPPQALDQPAIALYYGVILGTNSVAEARKRLELASNGNLLPEEKELLADLRRQLSSAPHP